MKSFFRENPALAFGLGLPLLLLVALLLISGIPTLLVDPPQYDVVYVTDYYDYEQSRVQISVVNQKIQVVVQGSRYVYRSPHLWRYSPKTGAVKEIPFLLPPGLPSDSQEPITAEEVAKFTTIEVPDLAGATLNSSSIAADGYEFSAGPNGYSGGVLSVMFYGGHYRYENGGVLTKNGRSILLPNVENMNYDDNARFIGWVVAP